MEEGSRVMESNGIVERAVQLVEGEEKMGGQSWKRAGHLAVDHQVRRGLVVGVRGHWPWASRQRFHRQVRTNRGR